MAALSPGTPRFGPVSARGDRVRLGTLILLRWMAIAGQLSVIFVAWRFYGIDLDLGLSLLAVCPAVLANLVAIFVFPQSKRLTEAEAAAVFLFDTSQLALLLSITGGLNNPFAVLIIAPATIAATALRTRATIVVALATVAWVTLIAVVHLPLRTRDGTEIVVPGLFGFGFWLAIVTGVVFLALYARRVAIEIQSMGDALLATQMALAREQKLTDLGGVVAAAAHELGTPLATIMLASGDLVEDLADQPALCADARLIREQADRCRAILRSMGRAGKDDLHMHAAPLSAVLHEAAEPHEARGRTIVFHPPDSSPGTDQPQILRLPEVIHGLRNFIQNAVDFAHDCVWIEAEWTEARITVRIADDGPGYPPQLLGRIGDPFMRRRREDPAPGREGYEGMGLGLFIAKTLLERTGAEVSFANGADPFLTEAERPERCGAIIEIRWPRDRIEAPAPQPLGANRPIL